ncbi:MAG: 50S ribosomal protein L24, partial [Leptonema sp. (in: Bacteria)]|nr:50S ribosomal protein L24 [Leptonema sp. (in: bacteria)]
MNKQMIAKLSQKEFNRIRYAKTALKTDDEVIVISGREKGKRGKIMEIDRLRGRV